MKYSYQDPRTLRMKLCSSHRSSTERMGAHCMDDINAINTSMSVSLLDNVIHKSWCSDQGPFFLCFIYSEISLILNWRNWLSTSNFRKFEKTIFESSRQKYIKSMRNFMCCLVWLSVCLSVSLSFCLSLYLSKFVYIAHS